MAVDTNPYANNNQQSATPSYLQQTNNPTVPGAISNMIKAIMAGNDQYKQQHMQQAVGTPALAAGSSVPGASSPTSVGGANGPMPLNGAAGGASAAGLGGASDPTQTAMMTGQLGSMAPTNPVIPDPVTQALMSPIPGSTDNTGFGGGFNPLSVGGAWG